MSEPVFENSMFTEDKSYEMSIRAWVCIQKATTGHKQAPWLILPHYNTLRLNFYSQLHAIFGAFNSGFSVNVYVSGTVRTHSA